jgi:flagellar protein FliO/FliZ
MTKFITPSRATSRVALPALGMATIGLALLAGACPAQAFTPASKHGGEALPLNFPTTSTGSHSSGGASIVRTIVGLLIVIAVIWGLTWILKQVKTGREGGRASHQSGSGLTSLATLALGSGRTLHLVRAGRDYLLVGSAEHGVAPIHHYTEEQARDAGLLDLPEPTTDEGDDTGGAGGRRIRPMQIPGQARAPGVPSVVSDALERMREWTVRR